MKAFTTVVVIAFACASAASPTHKVSPSTSGGTTDSPDARKLPLISVRANHFVDPQGNVVLFRGLAIADRDKIEHAGHWNQDFFAHA